MALPQPPPPSKSVQDTLVYFDKFDYPLTQKELWFWQAGTGNTRSEISSALQEVSPYYHLKGRENLIAVRRKRLVCSHKKIKYISPVVTAISRLPFIKAIFITGALSMFNSPSDDDIDIMIITRSNTLWLVRPLVVFLLKLKGLRRNPHLPEHSSARVADKICDNLWLDEDHLLQPQRNLYTAHELLQAKCVFDWGGIYSRFITENSWAKDYLPVAYSETLKKFKKVAVQRQKTGNIFDVLLLTINYLLFTAQYLYMLPRLTSEKVDLGYAFFHPKSSVYNR